MATAERKIVVVGAGQAGASLVARLRAQGFTGAITLIGEEPEPPYQRPPLSKGYLLGELARERLYLRPESWYAEHQVTLRTGATVTAIDRADRQVIVDGDAVPYDQLALCTGSVPHRLPPRIGGALAGVHVVRSLADVDAMAAEMAPGKRALIVGGGYIGLEAAAVARKMGLEVTLVELAERILARVAAPETAAWFRRLHAEQGVDMREGTGLDQLIGPDHVTAARLSDGTELPVDLVIVGIGIAPATALAEAAGLTIDNGIATGATGRTSDPNIWAAGDCASLPWRDGRIRLESVQNAIDQAEAVADDMLGQGTPYAPVPWFWSDQYDTKLQIVGLNTGYTKIVIRHDGAGLSHWYYADGRFLSVDAINAPRAYMVGKRLLENAKSPDPNLVATPETDLKALLKA